MYLSNSKSWNTHIHTLRHMPPFSQSAYTNSKPKITWNNAFSVKPKRKNSQIQIMRFTHPLPSLRKLSSADEEDGDGHDDDGGGGEGDGAYLLRLKRRKRMVMAMMTMLVVVMVKVMVLICWDSREGRGWWWPWWQCWWWWWWRGWWLFAEAEEEDGDGHDGNAGGGGDGEDDGGYMLRLTPDQQGCFVQNVKKIRASLIWKEIGPHPF